MKSRPERVPIESLCLGVTSGGTPSRSNSAYWDDGVIPWFKTGELNDWYVEEAEERITEEALSASSAKLFPPDTVLMAMYGDGKTITTLGLLRTEAATNQACCAMIANPSKCHFLYLFYALKYYRHELLKLVVAGAQRNLSGGIIRSFKVLCPPLATQKRIAAILSAYDDLIENNRRRMALLEDAARQLYREWFVRLRFPGYEHSRISNGVPKGWERKVLGELCEEIRESVSPEELEPDTPYIGLQHMPRRSISLNEWGTVEQVTSSKHRFREGEILFGKIRPYFHKVGIAFLDGVASSDAIIIRPFNAKLRGMVLMTVSSDPFVAVTSQTMREGSKMPRADWRQMQQYMVPLPPEGLLSNFESAIRSVLDQLRTLTFAKQKLRAARDLLLPRLMNGEIAV
jgi:type I restriction enzyme, S subunit